MPRNWSKAVPAGNDSVPQQKEFGPDRPTLADLCRRFEERHDRQLKLLESCFDQQDKTLDELMEETREPRQRSASLEQDVRQPRRTRDSGDNASAQQVDTDPIRLTSFGDDFTGPPALPCSRDIVLVDNGAAAPNLCLSSAEMRTRTAAGGLLPASKDFTARRIYYQPLASVLPD